MTGSYLVVGVFLVPICHLRYRNRTTTHGKAVLVLSFTDLVYFFGPTFNSFVDH